MSESNSTRATSYQVRIRSDWCKGCELCVEVCKPRVLEMDGIYAVVVNPDACTGCRLCELLCPDFAVDVIESENIPDSSRETPNDALSEVSSD